VLIAAGGARDRADLCSRGPVERALRCTTERFILPWNDHRER